MTLDQEFIKKVKPAIQRTWETIGSDLEACCADSDEPLDNEGAIESCIDAGRLGMYGCKDAQATVRVAIVEHTYSKVLAFLVKNIHLV